MRKLGGVVCDNCRTLTPVHRTPGWIYLQVKSELPSTDLVFDFCSYSCLREFTAHYQTLTI